MYKIYLVNIFRGSVNLISYKATCFYLSNMFFFGPALPSLSVYARHSL